MRRGISSSSRFVRRSRPSAAKEWGGAVATVAALSGAQSNFWILDPPAALQLDNPTFLTARVFAAVRQAAAAPAGGALATFGIIVASGDPDLTTVPTLVPDPSLDPEADWLYRWSAPIPPNSPGGTLWFNAGADTTIVTRARRRIPNGSGLMGVMSATGLGALSEDWTVDVRYLILTG